MQSVRFVSPVVKKFRVDSEPNFFDNPSIFVAVNGGHELRNAFSSDLTARIQVARRIKLEYISSERGPAFV